MLHLVGLTLIFGRGLVNSFLAIPPSKLSLTILYMVQVMPYCSRVVAVIMAAVLVQSVSVTGQGCTLDRYDFATLQK